MNLLLAMKLIMWTLVVSYQTDGTGIRRIEEGEFPDIGSCNRRMEWHEQRWMQKVMSRRLEKLDPYFHAECKPVHVIDEPEHGNLS